MFVVMFVPAFTTLKAVFVTKMQSKSQKTKTTQMLIFAKVLNVKNATRKTSFAF